MVSTKEMSKFSVYKDQRGVAVVLELVLLAVLVTAVGYVVYTANQEHQQVAAAPPVPVTTKTSVPAINAVVNSVTSDAQSEGTVSAQEGTSLQSADSSSVDATGVGGAYNESQF